MKAKKKRKEINWLPFLDTYITMSLVPAPEFQRILQDIWKLPFAA